MTTNQHKETTMKKTIKTNTTAATKKAAKATTEQKDVTPVTPAAEQKDTTVAVTTPAGMFGGTDKVAADLGPNAKFPFGIRITSKKGVEYERFKDVQARDKRVQIMGKFDAKVEAIEYVPYAPAGIGVTADAPAPEVVPGTPEKTNGNGKPNGKAANGKANGAAKVETPVKVKGAKKSTGKAKGTTGKAAKTPATDAADPYLTVKSKGVIYFPSCAVEKLAGL